MKTAKEANWYLVFKVKCPYCGCDNNSYDDIVQCTYMHCLKTYKVSKEVKELRGKVDEHLDKPMPPAIIRKNSN